MSAHLPVLPISWFFGGWPEGMEKNRSEENRKWTTSGALARLRDDLLVTLVSPNVDLVGRGITQCVVLVE